MALHPEFPASPYAELAPEKRWFPAAEELRSTAYEKLLPPLVTRIREEIKAWRDSRYSGTSPTSRALLNWWFETEHLVEQSDATFASFRYYFSQREAVETVIWLHDTRGVRDTLHIQDDVRVARDTGNLFLTNIHRFFLSDMPEPTLEDDDLRDYFHLDGAGPAATPWRSR